MKHIKKRVLIISMVVVLVLSLGATAAFAQGDEDVQPGRGLGLHFGRGHGPRGGEGLEALADALGISVDELQDAHQEAAAQRIEEAVEEGLITRDQGNTMLAMQALRSYLDKGAILADALDMSVEDVQAAREDGTLRDILNEIAPADLQEALQDAATAAVAQAVDDDVITQEQADLVLAHIEDGLGHFGFGRGGHFGGRGGGGGPRGGSGSGQGAQGGFGQFSTAFDA